MGMTMRSGEKLVRCVVTFMLSINTRIKCWSTSSVRRMFLNSLGYQRYCSPDILFLRETP